MPYLRAKAQDYYEELGGGVDTDVLDENIGTRQLQALTENVIFLRSPCPSLQIDIRAFLDVESTVEKKLQGGVSLAQCFL